MKIFKIVPWFICLLFFLSCARQTAPTGGPKDTIPPVLLKAIPHQGQTNYQNKSVELTFNEMLLLNNPKEQIIIIPDVGKDFDVSTKKNKLSITFENDLNENTTYSLNFRDAVQDITEKNPTKNLKLAFSTGNYIDSLSISGVVYDILKSKEIEDATVALFQSDTFDIFQHKPSYFSKTDKKGTFIIDNLKPGRYHLYAINDKSNNLIVESKSEPYGFLSKTLNLTKDTANITLHINHLDTRPLKITSARPSGTFFNIKTSKTISHYTVTSNTNIISSFTEDQENIRIYNTFHDLDSIQIQLHIQDSIYQTIDTTIYAKFSQRTLSPEPFTATPSDFRVIGTKGILSGKIQFNKPIHSINYDSTFYQIDSTTLVRITPEHLTLDTPRNLLTIHTTFDRMLLQTINTPSPQDKPRRQLPAPPNTTSTNTKPAISHQSIFSRNSFISIENDSSTAIRQTLKPTTFETTGIILVKIQTDNPNFIVQLLTRDYQVLETRINESSINFEDLEPSTYQIRLIIDSDGNKAWSPGNFYDNKQPEPITYYRTEKQETIINLKANWELGPLLITY